MRTATALILIAATLSGCGNQAKGDAVRRDAPLVRAARVQAMHFVDRVEAVGTARANEQVTLSAPVTERVLKLNFDDGEYIGKGQIVAVLAAGQEQAQLEMADARAREAKQQLERLNALKARGFATTSAVDTQVALAAQASAQASEARASIGDRVIRAPFSGWVSLRTISAGAVVNSGTPIAEISDISKIKLDFTVPETVLAQVRAGQPIQAVAAAWPDAPFSGTIATIDPVLNPETRAATVRAVLPNGDKRLKPGMLLTVQIATAERTAPAVPELAVVGEGDQSFVFIVQGDKVKRTPVRTGLRQNGMVEIVSGLPANARVVTEGVVKIADGQHVRLDGQGSPTGAGASKGD
ncbi:efflux RND transporter periplasmic adaptor subunit [Sphingomonas sp.]|uniref:efflux RND transporter periplasmic adaptor subunit n=1 Tax=Sphingomonas sp. TaxID=28214 RepID=UPI001AFFAF46|nr:efflux RND transporter periplasmic adaptor subunit [Sphingomonas sp.]MBO9712614.1 efflux RND transporter periplasmic adaptor subunit [Sphingomonas sp.]